MYTIETPGGPKTFLHMVKSAGTSVHTAMIDANKVTHVNQRHASIKNLPERWKKYPKIIVIRSPEEWYKSFYRFFLNVEGYMSFMLNDPKVPYDGYIYPITIDKFAMRSLNFKSTLIKFPNKARVFRNVLRSQANMHFITGYFEGDFSPDNMPSMEQFDCTLYEWFWKNAGGEDAIFVPMDRLDVVEKIFDIKIPHVNKTTDKPEAEFSSRALAMIRGQHFEFYQMIEEFDPENLMTYREFKSKKAAEMQKK